MAKNVVLIGATGFVGNAILNELVSRGHKVTAIVRNMNSVKVNNELIEYVVADATNPSELAAVAKGKDDVISAYNPGWANPRQYEETKVSHLLGLSLSARVSKMDILRKPLSMDI